MLHDVIRDTGHNTPDSDPWDDGSQTKSNLHELFHGDDLLALKAAFDDLEIAGAEVPDAKWSAEDFRDTLEGVSSRRLSLTATTPKPYLSDWWGLTWPVATRLAGQTRTALFTLTHFPVRWANDFVASHRLEVVDALA